MSVATAVVLLLSIFIAHSYVSRMFYRGQLIQYLSNSERKTPTTVRPSDVALAVLSILSSSVLSVGLAACGFKSFVVEYWAQGVCASVLPLLYSFLAVPALQLIVDPDGLVQYGLLKYAGLLTHRIVANECRFVSVPLDSVISSITSVMWVQSMISAGESFEQHSMSQEKVTVRFVWRLALGPLYKLASVTANHLTHTSGNCSM
jgi:hypothetical protein